MVLLNNRQPKIEAGAEPGGGAKPAIGRAGSNSAVRKNFSINPVVVRNAIQVRQGADVPGNKLWLDASARDALGFALMARGRTERPMPSPAPPLPPPLVQSQANHAERNDAVAI